MMTSSGHPGATFSLIYFGSFLGKVTLCLLQHFLFFCSVCSSRSLRYLSALSITVGLVAHEINIMEQSLDFHKKRIMDTDSR